uniref:Trans-1,2-dihydrobenzene-1,2-diol dehydrogenase n=1 Tax=Callorhinchus milii TaxID=7868 RepID=A0A4W3J4B1_CALMI
MATKWGICSVGRICHDFLVALRSLPSEDHEVVCVASRDLSRAKAFAKRHNIPTAYGSYEELAQDPKPDIIYVGTIHPCHLEVALSMMEAGKNVLCEKPLAMNEGEVQELVRTARQTNMFLMEGLWTRFFPVSNTIRSLLSQNVLGDIKMVIVEQGIYMMDTPRLMQKELGGGVLLDIGCNSIQFVCMVFKGEKPDSIDATGFLTHTGVDESVTIVLKYSGKRMAVVTVTMAVQLTNEATIVGTKGTIKIPDHMWCPTRLVVNREKQEFPLPEPSQPLNFPHSMGLRYEAEEVRQCLQKGLKECPLIPLAESELIASIMDEVRKQIGVIYPQDTVPGPKLCKFHQAADSKSFEN